MSKTNVPHPHDTLTRHFLTSPDLAADLIRRYGDKNIVNRLDLNSLKCRETSGINPTLAEQIGDLCYSAHFKNSERQSNVFIFLEHQSGKDALISLRLLRYILNSYEKQARTNGKPARGRILPYPVAMVLYNGKSPWRNFPRLPDLIQNVPGVKPDVLDFPLTLLDLSRLATDTIQGMPPVRALLTALQAAGQGEIGRRLDGITDIMAEAKQDSRARDWLTALIRYAALQADFKNHWQVFNQAYRKIMGKKEADDMATTTAERLQKEGEARGEAKGMAKSILTALESRFGPVPETTRKTVANCTDIKVLESWLVLAVTSKTLKDFKEGLR